MLNLYDGLIPEGKYEGQVQDVRCTQYLLGRCIKFEVALTIDERIYICISPKAVGVLFDILHYNNLPHADLTDIEKYIEEVKWHIMPVQCTHEEYTGVYRAVFRFDIPAVHAR